MSICWDAIDVQTNGVRLRCFRFGEGQPVLLLHGISANARSWGRAAEALARRRLVIAPDQRGHGHSDKPDSGYGDNDYMLDAAGLIEQLTTGPIDVIGHSMGGRIAAQLAAERPALLHRLILEEAIGSQPRSRPPEQLEAMTKGAKAWLETFRNQPRELAVERTHQQHPTWTGLECEAYADGQREFSMNVFGESGMSYDWNWRAILPRIQCPALVVGGDPGARTFPPSGMDDAAARDAGRLLPAGKLVQIPNAGHMLHLDQPDRFIEAVEQFLA